MNRLKKFLHIFKSPALSLVFRWSRCVRGRMLLICLLGIVSTLLGLSTTLLTKGLIDGAVSSNSSALYLNGGLLVAVILTERILRISLGALRTTTSAKLQRSFQQQMMDSLLSRAYPGLKAYHSGDLVNRVFSDVSVIKNGVLNLLPNICSIMVSFVGAVIILAQMNPGLVIALLLASIIGTGFMLLFRIPMKKRHKIMQEAEGRVHASMQETLENIRLVKASLSEARILKRVHADQQDLEQKQKKQAYFSLAMNQSLGVMFDCSWLICMLWGCTCIFRGQMTYGALAAMIQLIGRIQTPIASAADIAAQAYGVIASAERLDEILSLPADEEGEPVTEFEEIRLRDVVFAYDDNSDDVLRGITATIKKGDFVALTGISGGGKTSMFQLLLGMFQPQSGQVLFCGGGQQVPASRSTRRLFAYVPQGNSLISGTLRENLSLFSTDTSDEKILEAAKAACIDELVREIGLDAMIGERGIGLSEGQAQRVAVARALLSGAPILLLDESTSALDEPTEAKLLENIAAMYDKTCLIVTHRKAALSICNRCLHLENGNLRPEEA